MSETVDRDKISFPLHSGCWHTRNNQKCRSCVRATDAFNGELWLVLMTIKRRLLTERIEISTDCLNDSMTSDEVRTVLKSAAADSRQTAQRRDSVVTPSQELFRNSAKYRSRRTAVNRQVHLSLACKLACIYSHQCTFSFRRTLNSFKLMNVSLLLLLGTERDDKINNIHHRHHIQRHRL